MTSIEETQWCVGGNAGVAITKILAAEGVDDVKFVHLALELLPPGTLPTPSASVNIPAQTVNIAMTLEVVQRIARELVAALKQLERAESSE